MLVLVGAERLDLAQLVLEQVELALALPRRARRAPSSCARARASAAQALRACGQAPRAARAPQSAVEDLQLRRPERQLAVLVLAVEGEQPPAGFAQVRDVRRAAAEIGAGAPVGADPAGQDELRGVRGASRSPSTSRSSLVSSKTPST